MKWVKMPVDLPFTAERLPPPVQPTFWKCFAAARRSRPLRGYLLRPDLEPLSERELAASFRMALATCHRHLSTLIERRALVRDLANRLFMPLVAEERDARTDDTTTTMGESGASQQAALASAVPLLAEKVPKVEQTLLAFSSSELERRNVASIEEAGENDVTIGFEFLADDMAALAESVSSPDIRYLIAKLRRTTPAWQGFPASVRDVALLERLEATSPAALLAALEQESLSPTAKNPGAWLARTAPAIAMGREVAS